MVLYGWYHGHYSTRLNVLGGCRIMDIMALFMGLWTVLGRLWHYWQILWLLGMVLLQLLPGMDIIRCWNGY